MGTETNGDAMVLTERENLPLQGFVVAASGKEGGQGRATSDRPDPAVNPDVLDIDLER